MSADEEKIETEVVIVKEGFIYKRGEYIRNWRARYFYLLSDGNFVGYKQKPVDGPKETCYNVFDVSNAKVISTEIPKVNSFLIRFYQMTKFVDRLFRCDKKEDRDEWVAKIKSVSSNKKGPVIAVKNLIQSDDKTIGPYKLLNLLGQGSFGKVILAIHTTTNTYVAIKVLNKESIIDNDEISHIESEGKVMKSFNHPFLVTLLDFLQTKERIYFVMEFLNGGELYYHLRMTHKFSENRTKLYTAEIILALEYLHVNKITYRDLKLENTILDATGHIKLCDFGLCKDNTASKDRLLTFCGTREYLAPEIIMESAFGYSIDWWCLGILLYESLTGDLPFKTGHNDDVLYEKILYTPVDFRSYQISEKFKKLILSLLMKDPAERLGCKDIDGQEIKAHEVYAEYDWNDVYNRKYQPEFVPNLNGPEDTRYVSSKMLKTDIKFSPPAKHIEYEFEI